MSIQELIELFMTYLTTKQKASANTAESYLRDLKQLSSFWEHSHGIVNIEEVQRKHLRSYLYALMGEYYMPATIARKITSVKSFYRFLDRQGIAEDISDVLQTPTQEKRIPEYLTIPQMMTLLATPAGDKPGSVRDRAILELLYATGMKTNELIDLKVSDVDLRTGFVTCGKEYLRIVPFGNMAREALILYISQAREVLIGDPEEETLFLNRDGMPFSRQGLDKLVRTYGRRAGIEQEVTPHKIRQSCAAHMMMNGADLKGVQAMLGYGDVSAVSLLSGLRVERKGIRELFEKSHPRG